MGSFADIVLPDTCYLEYTDWSGIQHPYHNQTPAVDEPWCFHITQKVVEPQYGRRHAPQVLDDILDRMGCRAKLNAYYNHLAGFRPELAASLGLLPDGALDTINDAAFEVCDGLICDGDDPISVDAELAKEMLS